MPGEHAQHIASEILSDEQVVERVLAGETPLYEVIMRRYNLRLYRVARSIVGDGGEAEDVAQETYIRAFHHLAQFAGRAKFSTWLTRICVYEASARARKAKRFQEWDIMSEIEQHDLLAASIQRTPESEAASDELNRFLEDAITALPGNYAAVVMMRDVQELSTSETAECLSITEENVKVRLHRAHALLRKELLIKLEVTASQLFPFHATRCDHLVRDTFSKLAAL